MRAGERDDAARQLEHGDRLAIADVEDPREAARRRGKDVRRRDVLHENEIARLPAVSEDRQRLAGECLADEDRHRRRVGAVRILARAKDVEEAQRDGLDPPGLGELAAVKFAVEFRDRIRAARLGQHAFVLRHGGIVPVNRGGRAEAELAHAGGRGFLQHVEQTDDVQGHALVRPRNRFGHAHQRRQMKDTVNAANRRPHRVAIENRPLDEARPRAGEIFTSPGAEIVEHAHLGPAAQLCGEVTADETRAAGDENFHAHAARAMRSAAACIADSCASMLRTSAN